MVTSRPAASVTVTGKAASDWVLLSAWELTEDPLWDAALPLEALPGLEQAARDRAMVAARIRDRTLFFIKNSSNIVMHAKA